MGAHCERAKRACDDRDQINLVFSTAKYNYRLENCMKYGRKNMKLSERERAEDAHFRYLFFSFKSSNFNSEIKTIGNQANDDSLKLAIE